MELTDEQREAIRALQGTREEARRQARHYEALARAARREVAACEQGMQAVLHAGGIRGDLDPHALTVTPPEEEG